MVSNLIAILPLLMILKVLEAKCKGVTRRAVWAPRSISLTLIGMDAISHFAYIVITVRHVGDSREILVTPIMRS